MRSCSTFAIAFALALTIASANPASALYEKLTLTEIVSQANVIFVGTAGNTDVQENQAGSIVTWVTFSIDQVLKGSNRLDNPKEIVLHFAGGRIGERGMMVSGVPAVEEGRTYVMFIKHDGKDYASPVVGMNQGMFLVQEEPATGRSLVFTLSGNFIEGIKDGDLVIGAKAELDENGMFKSIVEETPSPELPPPSSEGSGGARVTAQQSIQPLVTDPAKAMDLEQFLAAVKAIIR